MDEVGRGDCGDPEVSGEPEGEERGNCEARMDPDLVEEDCPLGNASTAAVRKEDGFFCPPLPREGMEADLLGEKCESLLDLKPMRNQLLGIQTEQAVCSEPSEIDACAASMETRTACEDGVEGERCATLQLEAEVDGSLQESPDTAAPFSAAEGFGSEASCYINTVVDNCSSKLANDTGSGTSTCRKTMFVYRRSKPKRSASLRSTLDDTNPNQLSRSKNLVSKCTVAVDVQKTVLSRITNRRTRKRSRSRRAEWLPIWGAVESLTKIFVQNEEAATQDCVAITIQDEKSKKGSSGSGKQNQQAALGGRSSRGSKTKNAASSNYLPLKDERSQHSLSQGMVRLQASVALDDNDCLNNFKSKDHAGNDKKISEFQHKLGGFTCEARLKSLQIDGPGDKDLEGKLTEATYAENVVCNGPGVSSRSGTDALVEIRDDNRLLDPGTSPDADVYCPNNDVGSSTLVSDIPMNLASGRDQCALVTKSMVQHGLHFDMSTYCEAFMTHASVSPLHAQLHSNHKKGKQNGIAKSEHLFKEQVFSGPQNLNILMKTSKCSLPECKKQEVSNERNPICSESIGKMIRDSPNSNGFRKKSSLLGTIELQSYENSSEVVVGLRNPALPELDAEYAESETGAPIGSLLTDESGEQKLPIDTKAELNKDGCSLFYSARNSRRNAHKDRKKSSCKSGSKCKTKEESGSNDACIDTNGGTRLSLETDRSEVIPVDASSSVMAPTHDEPHSKELCHLEGQSLRPRAAWVCCDDCHKWRCIPAELADMIGETNCKWTCKDNKDKAFADCSIPQGKTNAEINAELELSDVSDEEAFSHEHFNFKATESSLEAGSKPVSWTLIKSNLFLHRNRKTQTIDEVMVCHCKRPLDGSLGCGEECLNRMLNIECVRGTCPCGDLCSNQKFQKREYVKFNWFHCGKKGYGLQLQEVVSRGQFLIEYVGEVLDFSAYEARQRSYASRSQKHFYFMSLNGGEVIDACTKGNLGRFINHSCDPNCRTEKWMVNGEVCIGLFAIRDLKKGEEVTFDYNYVRVFGAAAKKCFCGSTECQGYIGGDPSNSEAIVQGDSDEEFPEPVMICGDGERDLVLDGTLSRAIDAEIVKHKEITTQSTGDEGNLDLDGIFSDSTDVKFTGHEKTPIPLWDDGRVPNIAGTVSDAGGTTIVKCEEIHIQMEDLSKRRPSTVLELEDTSCRSLSEAGVLENSSDSSNSIQTEETMCRPIYDIQKLEISLGTSSTANEPKSVPVLHNKKSVVKNAEDKLNISKPCPLLKPSRPKVTVNKARPRILKKKARPSDQTLASQKSKRMQTTTSNRHFEGVEKKLNELLDEDGGINKRRDATKGYLKLLVVTAAEGDHSRGFSSNSTRDLSLILDALRKTKSRMVLMDIINKNGLQMLQKIMMQNRSDLNSIPIMRKILKALEFLALKEILTLEHINRGPPVSGMQSFKESILILTRHKDLKVNQIARNFRDKWIPHTIRTGPSAREDGQFKLSSSFKCRDQRTSDSEAIAYSSEAVHLLRSSSEVDMPGDLSSLPSHQASTSVPLTNCTTSGTSTRKRKTRWDHISDVTTPDPQSMWSSEHQIIEAASKFMKSASVQLEQTSQLDIFKLKSEIHKEDSSSCDNSMHQNIDGEAPPGFGSPCRNNYCGTLMVTSDMGMVEHPQKDDEAPPGFGYPQKGHHSWFPSKVVVGDVVLGHLQERYLPHLTVSYGIPVALIQQMGTPETKGGSQGHPQWAVAPGMPFSPFPPLPPYPRGKPYIGVPNSASSDHNFATHETKEETEPAKECRASRHTDLPVRCASGRPAHVETETRKFPSRERLRWPSHGSGRYFRPQRSGNQRFDRCRPLWPREGKDYGCKSSTRNGAFSRCTGSRRINNNDNFCFRGGSNGDNSIYFHQQQPHHN